MYVSGLTGEIWVADAGASAAIRYPAYNELLGAGGAANGGISDPGRPLAIVEDTWGNLFMPDAVNRVLTYYPGLAPINAANFLNPNLLAPGMIAALYSQGYANQFGGQPVQSTMLPLSATLNGLQVLFNGAPVPLFYADPNQINFQVPIDAPQSGIGDLQVVEAATGRVLGDSLVQMIQAAPGIFTQTGTGSGTAAATNQDNTLNSAANPAVQGSTITIYGTGQGFIGGAPPDGNVSNTQLQTAQFPLVVIGTGPVPPENIQYFGLSPALVGVWQLNVVIPDTVITTPTNPTQVIVIEDNVASGGGALGRPVLIYVKQKP